MQIPRVEYRALAEIRYRLRCFLNFSENAARAVKVEPQQHQLLLVLAGMPEGMSPTIGSVAERLQIRHNSAVELVKRSLTRGLVRKREGVDRREALLAITPRGTRVLEKLSRAHRAELRAIAPVLLQALEPLVRRRRLSGAA
jgi:DNA-binding MarR family transcriptional regulator